MLVVLKGHLSMDDDDERRWYDEYVGTCRRSRASVCGTAEPDGRHPWDALNHLASDLLQRFKLWDAAAAIVLASNNADVRSRSQVRWTPTQL